MGWYRVVLSEEEQEVVSRQRESHGSGATRRRLLVLWSLHCGLKREQEAQVSGLVLLSVQRIVSLYRDEGIDRVLQSQRSYVPTSELADYEAVIRQSLEDQPVRSIAEACQRIKDLTGIERGPTQVRCFLKRIGLKWQRVRAIPVPPKKVSLST